MSKGLEDALTIFWVIWMLWWGAVGAFSVAGMFLMGLL